MNFILYMGLSDLQGVQNMHFVLLFVLVICLYFMYKAITFFKPPQNQYTDFIVAAPHIRACLALCLGSVKFGQVNVVTHAMFCTWDSQSLPIINILAALTCYKNGQIFDIRSDLTEL